MQTRVKNMQFKQNLIIMELSESFEINQFQVEMLVRNQIDGLLPMQHFSINNTRYLGYDINGKITLNNWLEHRELRFDKAIELLEKILLIIVDQKRYLLSESNYCLGVNEIYISEKSEEIELIYLPFKDNLQAFDKFGKTVSKILGSPCCLNSINTVIESEIKSKKHLLKEWQNAICTMRTVFQDENTSEPLPMCDSGNAIKNIPQSKQRFSFFQIPKIQSKLSVLGGDK